jgi:hypothetical protein
MTLFTQTSTTNDVITNIDYGWQWSEWGWTYKGTRTRYIVKRKQDLITTEYRHMTEADSKTEAGAYRDADEDTLARIFATGGGRYTLEVVEESNGSWAIDAITTLAGGDS